FYVSSATYIYTLSLHDALPISSIFVRSSFTATSVLTFFTLGAASFLVLVAVVFAFFAVGFSEVVSEGTVISEFSTPKTASCTYCCAAQSLTQVPLFNKKRY